MFQWALLAVLAWCVVPNNGYSFDKSGCDNMLPKFDSVPGIKGKSTENKSGHNEETGAKSSEDLSPAFGKSPYELVVSSNKYRRNRSMTVRIAGGEFHGFMLQARGFQNGASLGSSIIGTFYELPPGVGTLDCFIGTSYSLANTAYSQNATIKKDLQLNWKAPLNDVGSIEFVATIISGQHYWTSIKSRSLLFNEFPPNLESCGVDRSCFHYADVHKGCGEDGFCDFVVVSQVVHEDVIFTIGGKIKSGTGYVGIGFTEDKHAKSLIDITVCIKTSSQKAETAHYIVEKYGQPPIKQNVQMEDAEADVDGNTIWCRFRRQLQIPNSKAADLTKDLYQLFLWGELDANNENPVLPKEDTMLNLVETWNQTRTVSVTHYVGSASAKQISWTILFSILLAIFLELCLM